MDEEGLMDDVAGRRHVLDSVDDHFWRPGVIHELVAQRSEDQCHHECCRQHRVGPSWLLQVQASAPAPPARRGLRFGCFFLEARQQMTNEEHERHVDEEVDARRGNGDAEVDFHEVGEDGAQQAKHKEPIYTKGVFDLDFCRFARTGEEGVVDQIDDQTADAAKGDGDPDEDGAQPLREEYGAHSGTGDPQADQDVAITPAAHDPQPSEAVVEDADIKGLPDQEAQEAGDYQGVEGFVVRAVGRGVAGFDGGQFWQVETVIGHVHRLGTVAD